MVEALRLGHERIVPFRIEQLGHVLAAVGRIDVHLLEPLGPIVETGPAQRAVFRRGEIAIVPGRIEQLGHVFPAGGGVGVHGVEGGHFEGEPVAAEAR